jgi:protein-S-isoprenylcysteine O-methyltransferase Ste14
MAVDREQRGSLWRDAGWVAAQMLLIIAFVVVPRGGPEWPGAGILKIAGWLLAAAGAIPMAGGALALGRNLTPFPRPARSASLSTTGMFAIVRHPMYAGGLLMCLGVVLATQNWPRLVVAVLLAAVVDAKARREEEMLEQAFPEYSEYRRRVRRLIPLIY